MYFCAVGLIALLPFAYLFCQVFTVVVYEGAWRWYCLAPLPLVVGGFPCSTSSLRSRSCW